jgi:hypothetical protein
MSNQILVLKIVNRYIGVSDGYLGQPDLHRFTIRNHKEFYPEYCGLDKNPDQFEGTTRQKFISIFQTSTPVEQAKIIKGIVERFPVGEGPRTRTMELRDDLHRIAEKLSVDYIAEPDIANTSEAVFEALKDADNLLKNREAVSAVDRVHTAFHGYLKSVCASCEIDFEDTSGLVSLVKKVLASHPKLKINVDEQPAQNIVKSLAAIADSLNPIRNHSSLAHPNKTLLEEPEARLVVNTVRTLMTYLESKLR